MTRKDHIKIAAILKSAREQHNGRQYNAVALAIYAIEADLGEMMRDDPDFNWHQFCKAASAD